MKEALQPFFSSRTVSFLIFAYGLPSALGLGIWWLFLRQAWERLHLMQILAAKVAASGISGLWLFVLGWALLTLGLGLNATFWFRLHEGYYYPRWISERRAATHHSYREHRRLRALEVERNAGRGSLSHGALRRLRRRTVLTRWRTDPRPVGMLRDWRSYPTQLGDYLPTKLGNRIRSFERYGNSRYGLDVLILWYDFINAARAALLTEIQTARERVEVFLAACVVAELLALAGIAPLLSGVNREQALVPLSLVAASSIAAATIFYNLSVAEVDEWYRSIAALINSSRESVARNFGVRLPSSLEHEIFLWQVITGYVRYGGQEYAQQLNEVRAKYPSPDPALAQEKLVGALTKRNRLFWLR